MKRFLVCFSLFTVVLSACAQPYNQEQKQLWLRQVVNAEQSSVLLNNQGQTIPLGELQNRKIASLNFGVTQSGVFDSLANNYAEIARFSRVDTAGNVVDLNSLGESLKFYNTFIIQVADRNLNENGVLPFILENQNKKQIILVVYGNDRVLAKLDSVTAPIIWSPAETAESAVVASQIVFGGLPAKGKLQSTVSLKYKQNDGFITQATRLSYSIPEAAGISSAELEKPIDAIVGEALSQKATPGAVVLVAKDGKVIFNKAYGHHTYENVIPVKASDIFDLASITKIAATTMAAMRLYEQGKLNLDANLGTYIAEARSTNKNSIKVKDLMLHQAGLVSYIPFYRNLRPADFARDSSELYSVKVADNYYLRRGYYDDVMWPTMVRSGLQTSGKYVYSDLSMYFMKEILERQTAQGLSQYVQEQFYRPLGMSTAGYNPRNRFPKDKIVPTERDNYFRMTLVEGYVHDQGAAMAGGVSGHAGLFSSANDLAILFQMMLNKGSYGGVQYFKPETIELFTSRQSPASRRGLGFDRWDPDPDAKYPSELASPETYGHTGFTGTCVWVDPKYNLTYVFLSNRVQSPGGNKLQSMKIRQRIQDAIYRAIQKSELAVK